jgi:hypothetical protein
MRSRHRQEDGVSQRHAAGKQRIERLTGRRPRLRLGSFAVGDSLGGLRSSRRCALCLLGVRVILIEGHEASGE